MFHNLELILGMFFFVREGFLGHFYIDMEGFFLVFQENTLRVVPGNTRSTTCHFESFKSVVTSGKEKDVGEVCCREVLENSVELF